MFKVGFWLLNAVFYAAVGAACSALMPASPASAASKDCTHYETGEIEGARGTLICAARLDLPSLPGAGYRVLYRTQGAASEKVITSGLVLTPAWAPGGTAPTVLYAHATTGLEPACGPSLHWRPGDQPSEAIFPGMVEIVRSGYAAVAPDYIGLGATPASGSAPAHPYLHPGATANALLDAVRAFGELPDFLAAAGNGIGAVRPSGDLVMIGHSQGAHAVLSAVRPMLEAAPAIRLKGVAASGAPARIDRIVTLQRSVDGAVVTAYLLHSLQVRYPPLSLAAVASQKFIEAMPVLLKGCLRDAGVGTAHKDELAKKGLLTDPLTGNRSGSTFGRQLAAGALPDGWVQAFGSLTPPPAPGIANVPVLLVQAGLDELVPPSETAETLLPVLCPLPDNLVHILSVPLAEHDDAFEIAVPDVLAFIDAAMRGRAPAPAIRIPGKRTATTLPLTCRDILRNAP